MSVIRLCAGLAGLLLIGCGSHAGFKGIPELLPDNAIIWHYNCEEVGLNVEYANMGGQYSATINIPELGRRVLYQQGSGNQFVLDTLLWQSSDNRTFVLSDGAETLLAGCLAMNRMATDDIQLNFNGDLFGE